MASLPVSLQSALTAELARHDPAALAHAHGELSAWYHDPGAAGTPFRDDTHRAAYVAARLPATFAAAAAALRALAQALPDFRPGTHLDLGAGPGTAAWAAEEVFGSVGGTTFVERDAGLADWGRRLRSGAGRVHWIEGDLADPAPWPAADLVTCSYAYNELAHGDRALLLARAWAAARGALVVVEPGTPAGFANILEARRTGLALGARVVAPCPHEGACPLEGSAAWCHFAARVERRAAHRRAKGAELGWEDEKFAYLALARESAEAPAARILDRPLVGPGVVRLGLCTSGGLREVAVGKGDRDAFRRARKAAWGDGWPEG